MTRDGTPLEHYERFGLYVKREDLCCPGGPNFSKTRGVYAHVLSRPEPVIGVLDTAHSQGGWAVAKACSLLGKRCHLYYPVRKAERGGPIKLQQQKAEDLGARLHILPAGRSAVLYHRAKKVLAELGHNSYFMPNALKLPEMITETVAELGRTKLPDVGVVLVSASSGTIAAGVLKGLVQQGWEGTFVVHQGYSRPQRAILAYMEKIAERPFGLLQLGTRIKLEFVDEGYSYADEAREGFTPPWPCNSYYDLKAFRWWTATGRTRYGKALLWNIG